MILFYLRMDGGDGGAWRPKRAGCGLGPVLEATLLMAGSGACAGRKLGYLFWPGLSRGGPVFVEQSAQTLSASDLVIWAGNGIMLGASSGAGRSIPSPWWLRPAL
jgi:hypothetical protein